MHRNVPGCAAVVLGMAVVSAVVTLLTQTQGNEERQRLPRMRLVLAVITDKGIATLESRDRKPGRPFEVTADQRHWIRFDCQIGGAIREGSRLSLFPLDERDLWSRFEKGRQYEAHYDPELDECILVVDEPPGGLSARTMATLLACGITAALALVVIVAARRTRDGIHASPGSPGV